MSEPLLHLASASPRRREILAAIGVGFTFAGVDIDETPATGERATNLVMRLAGEKATAGNRSQQNGMPVIGADTIVLAGDRILGKPASKEDALEMLALLSDRTHRVLTAVAIISADDMKSVLSDTKVRFREITPDEASAYWQSGEPEDKAGAYAIQGKGGMFVESLSGSYSGVVGLPVFETAALLRWAGISVLAEAADQA
ncbi:MAG: septum formation protein [Woeseiaceae bacterium]|jgi:septum formation protein